MSYALKLLQKAVKIKFIKHNAEYVLKICLPGGVYLNLKRWVASKIYIVARKKPLKIVEHKDVFDSFRIVPCSNQRKKADLVICCAFKGRHEILEQSIMESLHGSNEFNIEWFLCGSTEDDFHFIQQVAAKTGKVAGIIWKNNPLGEKWHYCVKTAGDLYDAELYGITGSDDILSSTLIRTIIFKHKNKLKLLNSEKDNTQEMNLPAMYCANQWVIVRLPSFGNVPSAVECTLKPSKYSYPIGAGRFYSKEFFERVNSTLFDSTRDSCLDDYGYFKALELGYNIEPHKPDDGSLISVKGNWQQMNQIEDILKFDKIEVKDLTFSQLDKFKKEVSPELLVYLFKSTESKEHYAWA